jgi:hypothetical protein
MFTEPTLVLMIVVLSISVWSGCSSATKVVVTDLRVGGDDGLTQRFAVALRSGIERSPDFVTDRKNDAGLVMTIPSNLTWSDRQGRLSFTFVVEFVDARSTKLGVSTGVCWEDEMGECAESVLKDARKAVGQRSAAPRSR